MIYSSKFQAHCALSSITIAIHQSFYKLQARKACCVKQKKKKKYLKLMTRIKI